MNTVNNLDKEKFEKWLGGYLKAWRSNDPEHIRALFTAEAQYFTQAFRPPRDGIDEIVESWIDRDDVVGNWTFESEWLAIQETSAVLEGLTTYLEPPYIFKNIWLIRLNEADQCIEFKEWWIKKAIGIIRS